MKLWTDPDPDLEKWIHLQLRQLPEQTAPPTLIPRIFAAIEVRARQWWRRPWLNWPRPAQLLSSVVLLSLLVSAAWWIYAGNGAGEAGSAWESFLQRFPMLGTFWALATSLLATLLALVRAGQPWLLYGAAIMVMMYVACLGIGTACFRVAVSRANRQ